MIYRKVTNGYQAMWAAEADVQTTGDTARVSGATPFAMILSALT